MLNPKKHPAALDFQHLHPPNSFAEFWHRQKGPDKQNETNGKDQMPDPISDADLLKDTSRPQAKNRPTSWLQLIRLQDLDRRQINSCCWGLFSESVRKWMFFGGSTVQGTVLWCSYAAVGSWVWPATQYQCPVASRECNSERDSVEQLVR